MVECFPNQAWGQRVVDNSYHHFPPHPQRKQLLPITQHPAMPASANSKDAAGKADPYSALPPAAWDCTEYHPCDAAEEVQPGDEDFLTLHDDNGLLIIREWGSYRGTLRMANCTMNILGIVRIIAAAGLMVTHALPTKFDGAYALRLRPMTPTEKELIHDLS